MNNSVQALCHAIKKIIWQLKPLNNGFSFLILTGKPDQGKITLLRQSGLRHIITEGEAVTDIYYNEHGIIVHISESWIHQSKTSLSQTLKQLNRCYRHIKITGILLCIDVNELTEAEPIELSKHIKTHNELLHHFGINLNYRIDIGIIITKIDALAGFCEFYQHEHENDLCNPLGFSLNENQNKDKLEKNFKIQFDLFTESLGQQVLNKVHPARSGIKRTLIREFPVQIGYLRLALQSLVESISPKFFRVQSVFFTSARQGGFSHDNLNKRIQQEYALTLQNTFPLSSNYRAYFIQGALLSFQQHTKQNGLETNHYSLKNIRIIAGITMLSLLVIAYHHYTSIRLLDETSKEWIAYDTLTAQHNGDISALHHLTNAYSTLEKVNNTLFPLNSIKLLKEQLDNKKTEHLNTVFLPNLLKEVEAFLADNQQPYEARYAALKIYLMFGEPEHYQPEAVTAWFQKLWEKEPHQPFYSKKLALLNQTLKSPLSPIQLKREVINDTRNYLNALPISYLHYALAKNYFPTEKKSIEIKGFSLASTAIPLYFTKDGFRELIPKLPIIANILSNESWVLGKQSPYNLKKLLEQAYSYDYVLWWKNFIQKSAPLHVQSYQDAIHLTQMLRQHDAINTLTTFIQDQTSPELNAQSTVFNQQVASQFTDLNLISDTALNPLNNTITEMVKFLTTISVVNDQGKTAFTISKSRYQGDNLPNPLSLFFTQTAQLPEPVSSWVRQLASDTSFILMNDAKNYINIQWKNTVYRDYINTIMKRYPFDPSQTEEVALEDFNHFFSTRGVLNSFVEQYIKPFLDTSEPEWKLKELNNFVLPVSPTILHELIRANIITNMFFAKNDDSTSIEFNLQKSDLAPVVQSLLLVIGNKSLNDTQQNNSFTHFQWPESDAKLTIYSNEGEKFTVTEHGIWAFFRLLQKVEVQTDANDNTKLQVLFEINGHSGRYLLTTKSFLNPFTPGILSNFTLSDSIA